MGLTQTAFDRVWVPTWSRLLLMPFIWIWRQFCRLFLDSIELISSLSLWRFNESQINQWTVVRQVKIQIVCQVRSENHHCATLHSKHVGVRSQLASSIVVDIVGIQLIKSCFSRFRPLYKAIDSNNWKKNWKCYDVSVTQHSWARSFRAERSYIEELAR